MAPDFADRMPAGIAAPGDPPLERGMPSAPAPPSGPPRCSLTARDIVPALRPGETPDDWALGMQRVFGTNDPEVIAEIAELARQVLGKDERAFNVFVAGLAELKPRDHLERLLIAQMLLVQHKIELALEAATKAYVDAERDIHERKAIRFMRLFCQQVGALKKYRRDASQTITVNHIHADKAVVAGTVQTGGI